MKIVEVKDGELIISIELKKCSNCGKPMLGKYRDDERKILKHQIAWDRAGVELEHYSDSVTEICERCVEKKGYPITCSICGREKKYPQEFRYRVWKYPDYEDGDFEERFICGICLVTCPRDVISALEWCDDKESLNNKQQFEVFAFGAPP